MCKQLTSRACHAPAPEHAAITLIGAVQTPRVWSLAELRALPRSKLIHTMICDANPFPPNGWETVEWSGVALDLLLREADVEPGARSAEIAGLDGALTSFDLDDLGGALLALDANGQPLSAAQGFPARLIVPGERACAMPRFVQRLMIKTQKVHRPYQTTDCALITRAERVGGAIVLEGQAYCSGSGRDTYYVVVRCDDGPDMYAAVDGNRAGVAGTWALEWPWHDAHAEPQFEVAVVAPWSPAEAGERPAARRWKPALHRKVVAR